MPMKSSETTFRTTLALFKCTIRSNTNLPGSIVVKKKEHRTVVRINTQHPTDSTAATTQIEDKSLNTVETIHISGGASVSSHHSTQTFRYIIVIDFEATCWAKNDTQKWKKNEIIEFPAVLLNLTNGRIESEFRQYVMPIENPRLSDFCTELTGIRQDQVDDGVPLHTCLSLFNKWIKQTTDDHKLILPKTNPNNQTGNVALATWSDWDLGTCLSKECTRKRINKPTYFDQWIDVRAIYKKLYQHNPNNFNDALNKLGMQFSGRPHCGLDDSRNIARLIARMCKDGANFVITKDLKPFELFNQ